MRVAQIMKPDPGRRIVADRPHAAVLLLTEQVRDALRLPELALMVTEHDGAVPGELEGHRAPGALPRG